MCQCICACGILDMFPVEKKWKQIDLWNKSVWDGVFLSSWLCKIRTSNSDHVFDFLTTNWIESKGKMYRSNLTISQKFNIAWKSMRVWRLRVCVSSNNINANTLIVRSPHARFTRRIWCKLLLLLLLLLLLTVADVFVWFLLTISIIEHFHFIGMLNECIAAK